MELIPSPNPDALVEPPVDDDVLARFERDDAPGFVPYGSGKAALRDAVRLLDPAPGANVLLPTYLPDGVVEPFREAGLEVRFYAIDESFRPDVAEVEECIDERTVALVAVHYFGFPQPALPELRTLCDNCGIALVEDNAHAPLSRDGDALLGTTGDLAVTSFHKLFAVPNGACLLVGDDDLRENADRLELAGVADRYSRSDLAFVARALTASVTDRRVPSPGALVDWLAPGRDEDPERDPVALYQAAKRPLSKLSVALLRRTSRTQVVEQRRRNFAFWTHALSDVDGIEPVHTALPAGVCPQAFPAVVVDLEAVFGDRAADVSTWPPLPDTVEDADEFETATWLADRLVRLPVHHDRTPADLQPLAMMIRLRDGG